MRKFLFSIAIFLLATNAQSGMITGQKLYEMLSSNQVVQRTAATGYVTGVFDMGDGVVWCETPDYISIGNVADITLKYLRDNPESRKRIAHFAVIFAMQDLFGKCGST